MVKYATEHLTLPSLQFSTPPPETHRHLRDRGDDWADIEDGVHELSILEDERSGVQSPVNDSPEVDRVQYAHGGISRASRKARSVSKFSARRTPSERSARRSQRLPEHDEDQTTIESARIKAKFTSDAWSRCNKILRDHDRPMVEGWKEDIDTLLVFAGLFSAVLTAFIVESYTFLQPDPQGTASNILREILNEIRSNTSSPTSANTDSQFPFITPNTRGFSIRVNTVWFCSLVFSLSAASVGILVKQWLRDYSSHAGSSAREAARIRQFRYNGLVKWHIPEIIAALPVLLQWALGLFFIGLIDLLWSLDFVVAGIVTAFACTSLAFIVITTVLPAFLVDSPHRSPQALAFYLSYKWTARMLVWITVKVIGHWGLDQRPWPLYAPAALFRGRWRRSKLWLVKLFHERPHSNWREREKHVVRTQEVSHLDRQILAGADMLFMDNEILEEVIKPCIKETELSAAAGCLFDILTHRADGTIDNMPSWKPSASGAPDPGVTAQLRLTVDILENISSVNEEQTVKALRMLDRLCRAMPFEEVHPDTKLLYEEVYDQVSALLGSNHAEVRQQAFSLLYTLFPRANVAVKIDPIVIENIISFARASKERSDGDAYFNACVMALQFGADLSGQELKASRSHLHRLLQELEQYVTTTHALPSPSLRAALYDFSQRDATSVRPELFDVLNQLASVNGAPSATAIDDRALRNLRRLYSNRRPVRQSAILPTEHLQELGLSLPELPQHTEAPDENGSQADEEKRSQA